MHICCTIRLPQDMDGWLDRYPADTEVRQLMVVSFASSGASRLLSSVEDVLVGAEISQDFGENIEGLQDFVDDLAVSGFHANEPGRVPGKIESS